MEEIGALNARNRGFFDFHCHYCREDSLEQEVKRCPNKGAWIMSIFKYVLFQLLIQNTRFTRVKCVWEFSNSQDLNLPSFFIGLRTTDIKNNHRPKCCFSHLWTSVSLLAFKIPLDDGSFKNSSSHLCLLKFFL